MTIHRLASLGIKRQVMCIAALTCTVALLLAVSAFITVDWRGYRAQATAELQVLADVTGSNSAAALDFIDRGNAQEALNALWAQRHIMCAALYDRTGAEFVSISRPDARQCVPERAQAASRVADRESIHVLRPVRLHGELVGSVYLVSDLKQIEENTVRYAIITVVVLAIALASAVALSAWLQQFVTRPILHLADVARHVSEHRDYSVRARATPSPDLAVLVTGFNNMLERMAEHEAESLQKNEWLEQKVNERTNDLQRVNQELVKAKEAAEAASRAKSEFLANMSHEIRTPINGILGMTELALETQLTEEQRECLEMVRSSGDVLLGVINDILDFSKVESGKLDIESIDFDLHDCIAECIRPLAARAHEKRLELAYYIEPDVPQFVAGDPGRIRQVIGNLVNNAIKFTDRGEVVIWVRRELPKEGGLQIHFTVTDTGIGIPKEKHAVLFQPFTQADSSMSRRYGGTGLGLAICSRLVHLMNGTIELDSEEAKGSTFHVRVPVKAPASPPVVLERVPACDLGGLRVLVVDDNSTNRLILSAMLRTSGMDVTTVATGVEALHTLRDEASSGKPFRLVVVDAHMPEMDGFTLAERLKADPACSSAVIMMLTSGGQRGDGARCRELGIAAYLLKPIRRTDLLRAIASVVNARSEQRSNPPLFTRYSLGTVAKSLRVLVAEDNPVNQRFMIHLLEKDGHQVTLANDGNEAVDRSSREEFDLIFMDVQMPNLDGFAATAKIREREATIGRHTPIVAMTAHALAGYRERCLAGGMDDYVSKPAKLADIRRVLSRYSDSAPVASHASGLWDRAKALEQAGGDANLLAEMLSIFLAHSGEVLAHIERAIAVSDPSALEHAAHSLKGELGCVAAIPLMERARQLEENARNGNFSGAEMLLRTLRDGLEQLRPMLLEFAEVKHEAVAGR